MIGFTGFYWVSMGFNWFLMGFTGFQWVLLGFTGFCWVAEVNPMASVRKIRPERLEFPHVDALANAHGRTVFTEFFFSPFRSLLGFLLP